MSSRLEDFLNELIHQSKNDSLSSGMLSLIGDLYLKYSMDKEGKSIDTVGFDKSTILLVGSCIITYKLRKNRDKD